MAFEYFGQQVETETPWMEQQINKRVENVLSLCCGASFQYFNILNTWPEESLAEMSTSMSWAIPSRQLFIQTLGSIGKSCAP